MSAFALQYQDGFLDLKPGESPLIEWASLAFGDADVLPGSFSYSITLADTPNNALLLGFSNRLANRAARKNIEVLVILMGMPWKHCTLSYEIDNGEYVANLKIDNGEFATVIKETELPNVFVNTLNGAFSSHKWLSLGNNLTEVGASIHASTQSINAKPYAFFPFINDVIFGDGEGDGFSVPSDHSFVINDYQPGSAMQLDSLDAENRKQRWFSPSFYLHWAINQVCAYLGYTAEGDFMESEFMQSATIFNLGIYRGSDFDTAASGGDGSFKLAPARHLPKIKLADFFKQLRQQFKLVCYFNSDSKTATFNFAKTLVQSVERIDLDGCIQKGFKIFNQETTGYELIQGFDPADDAFKIYPYVKSFFIGQDKVPKQEQLPIGTTFMRTVQHNATGLPYWRIPLIRQTGNAYSAQAEGSQAHNPDGWGRNEFAFTLLSFRGLQPNSAGNTFPLATSDGTTIDPTDITTPLSICDSLWLGGENGILNRYHKIWYQFFLRTERVELQALMPVQVLKSLSPLKKVRWAAEDGIHLEALMDKLQFTADGNRRLIAGKLSVYPYYNAQAADISAFVDISAGQNINAGDVWVKMVQENIVESRKPSSTTIDLVFYFYYDQAMAQPRSVTALPLKIQESFHGTNNRFVSQKLITELADGTSWAKANQTAYYFNRNGLRANTEEHRYWLLLDSPTGDYKVIR